MEAKSIGILNQGYELYAQSCRAAEFPLPQNKGLLRGLDCAVINMVHKFYSNEGKPPFDSVRGYFSKAREFMMAPGFLKKAIFRYACATLIALKAISGLSNRIQISRFRRKYRFLILAFSNSRTLELSATSCPSLLNLLSRSLYYFVRRSGLTLDCGDPAPLWFFRVFCTNSCGGQTLLKVPAACPMTQNCF